MRTLNIAMERHKYFTFKQQEQSIDEYVTSLINISLNCEFGALREDLVRDIFTCGLSPKMGHIRERLLSEGGITLNKAVEIAKNMSIAKENANKLQQSDEFEPVVNVVRKGVGVDGVGGVKTRTKYMGAICRKCGQIHINRCPADGVKCHNCGKSGHFARMCFLKKKYIKYVYADDEEEEAQNEGDDGENLFIGALTKTTTAKEWNIEVKINNNKSYVR